MPQLPIFSKDGELSVLGHADITIMLLCSPKGSCQVSVFIIFPYPAKNYSVMILRIHGFKKLL